MVLRSPKSKGNQGGFCFLARLGAIIASGPIYRLEKKLYSHAILIELV